MLDLAQQQAIIIKALEDIKANEILTLDVHQLTTMTDTMIICTGTSNRHVKSIANSVEASAKENNIKPVRMQGEEAGEWIVIDLGGIIVHVMQASVREFYDLEALWALPNTLKTQEKA